MEPELRPATAAEVERFMDWETPPLDAVPDEMRPAVVAYRARVSGLRDCFDSMDNADLAVEAAGADGRTTPASVDSFVRAHLGLLEDWWLAIDSLDAIVRGPYGLPDWAEAIVTGELQSLFDATTALERAVITYHHGSAGPYLSRAYGYQYALSNGTVAPF